MVDLNSKEETLLSNLDRNRDFFVEQAASCYGLASNDVRKLIWPRLLGVDKKAKYAFPSDEELEKHRDSNQVELDVNRLRALMPSNLSEEQEEELKLRTKRVCMAVLLANPELHYYQGFHDICYIFIHVLDDSAAFYCVEKLANRHLKQFMDSTMDKAEERLSLIYVLLHEIDHNILYKLEELEVEPTFAISWILTWFTHVLPEVQSIVRLYDLFLADQGTHLPVYMTAAIILLSVSEVTESLADFGELYLCLTQLPKRHSAETVVSKALELQAKVPPERLLELWKKHVAIEPLPSESDRKLRARRRRLTWSGRLGHLRCLLINGNNFLLKHKTFTVFSLTLASAVVAYVFLNPVPSLFWRRPP